MTIHTSPSLQTLLEASKEENKPFFAWENLASGATLGGTTPLEGGERENAITGATYNKWRVAGTSTGRVSFEATFGSAPRVDTAAIIAHNLSSLGGGVVFQYQGANRTNLLRYSEAFDNAAWTKSNSTVLANQAIGFDGQPTMDRVSKSAGPVGVILQSVTPAGGLANKTFTFSVDLFTDSGQPQQVRLYLYGSSGLENIVTEDLVITPEVTRYEVSISFGASPTSSGIVARVDLMSSLAQYAYVSAAQFEQGASTSYVPTTSSSVTSNWYDYSMWAVPVDNSPIVFRMPEGSVPLAYRFLFSGISAAETLSVGVAFIGQALIMPQGFYQGFSPILTPTEVQLQSNVSMGNEILGSSVIGRGSSLKCSFSHIPDSFFRAPEWLSFQRHFNDGGAFIFGWRPSKYPQDVHYCMRSGAPIRPENSGPRHFMGISISAQVHNAQA